MKNGFINAPQGAIIIWDRSNTCPAGFVLATEIPNNAFVRYASSVNLSPVSEVWAHTHTNGAPHYHATSHSHTGTTNIPTSYGASYGSGLLCAEWDHTHAITLEGRSDNSSTVQENLTTTTGTVMVPYFDILHCRRQ